MVEINVTFDSHSLHPDQYVMFCDAAKTKLEWILQQAGVSEGNFDAYLEVRTRLRKPIHSFGLSAFSSTRRLRLIFEIEYQSKLSRLVQCTLCPTKGRQSEVYEKVKSFHIQQRDAILHDAEFLRKQLEASYKELHELIKNIRATRRKLKDVS